MTQAPTTYNNRIFFSSNCSVGTLTAVPFGTGMSRWDAMVLITRYLATSQSQEGGSAAVLCRIEDTARSAYKVRVCLSTRDNTSAPSAQASGVAARSSSRKHRAGPATTVLTSGATAATTTTTSAATTSNRTIRVPVFVCRVASRSTEESVDVASSSLASPSS